MSRYGTILENNLAVLAVAGTGKSGTSTTYQVNTDQTTVQNCQNGSAIVKLKLRFYTDLVRKAIP